MNRSPADNKTVGDADRSVQPKPKESRIGIVVALAGLSVFLLGCLSCFGVGVSTFLMKPQPAEQLTSLSPRADSRPDLGEQEPFPRPNAPQPPPNAPGDKPIDLPPARRAALADELIRNGDFEQGMKGFRTAYRHSPDTILDTLTFALVRNPQQVHMDAAAFGDHTSGLSMLMAINGGDAVDRLLWGQTVGVRPGADYTLSLWLTSWFPFSPAELEVRINGRIVQKCLAPDQPGEWKEFKAKWNAGADKEASLEIFNLTRAISGNDFALDDISLRGPAPARPVNENR
jgi:hypothetical protein